MTSETPVLNDSSPPTAPRRLALGLSSRAWPLLQRLQQSGLTDQLALTPGAAAAIAAPDGAFLVNSAAVLIQQHWQEGGVLMVIGATGAVTRLIAPLLTDKGSDPAVLVLDAEGQRVIPLLGGHQAGAEQLSREVAAALGSGPWACFSSTELSEILGFRSFYFQGSRSKTIGIHRFV